MLGNPVSQTLTGSQAHVLAQSYLDQARSQKSAQHLEWALALYDQAKVTFKYIANARHLVPPISGVRSAFIQARAPQTPEEEALRQRIAEVYFERAELLDDLGKPGKAQASRNKAQEWGYGGMYPGMYPVSIPPAILPSVSGMPALTQTATSTLMAMQQLPVASSTQAKSELVDYLFEKALSMLGSLEVSNKPSLFLVYAHDNPAHGQADAGTSKYLIDKLSKIRVNLYSDQTPMGQPYSSSPEDVITDSQLEDILTSQLCLLPDQLRADVKPVEKVVVCCSEVLGNYLKKWGEKGSYYDAFCTKLEEAYRKDLAQTSTSEIREVIKEFSQTEPYKAGFHHVLTEIAFLQIRAQKLGEEHGIIPISLTPKSYKECLDHFVTKTRVRMEDIPRFEEQAKQGKEIYPNQSRHWVLFKLIERVLVGSDEAKTFLNKFWQGYSDFISRLNNENAPSSLGELGFVKFIDSIFDGIRTALHSQLVFTVQQHHQQMRVFHADPKALLKEQYFDVLKEDTAFKETLQLYVAPRGKASLQATDTSHLLSKVQELLSDKHVILLTGDSGAGKTTFNRILEKHLWDNKKETDAIPLFISLASIDKPEHDLITKALKKKGLSEFQIQKLKKEKQRFVFILDGYDESRQTQNLYLHNRINQPDGWQGHMIISCRREYLGQNYRSRFQPNLNLKDEDPSFQEVVIEPFSEKERNQYLEKYVQHNPTGWMAQQYQKALEQQPHLQGLISNPFLLRVALEALPYLESEGKARSAVQLRMDLYAQFVRLWFERNQQRLSTQNLTGAHSATFRALCGDDFAEHGIAFVQELAVHLYTENACNPVVEYSLRKDRGSWKEAFFGQEEEKQLLREAWPLTRSGNQYRFIHKSLLEHFVARALFDSFDACMAINIRPRRGSNASVYSFENQAALPRQMLKDFSLASKHWVSDLGVVHLLTERVWQEPPFQKQLLAIVERSKTDAEVRQAAANAMTILVRAGVQFNEADLKNIQIPGADLSNGVFNSAQLQGADLRKANLRNIWLRQANLSGAQMAGVQFGEWPFLQEDSEVNSCVYSPDGKTCTMGLGNGTISVYATSNWGKIHTLSGHTKSVSSVAYSPNGQQIVSGSDDHTVRLWNAHSGLLCHTLRGHTNAISSVAFSPNSQQIASGSNDRTVRLWDAHSGQHRYTLSGHTNSVTSVAYSPNGQQIASGSLDDTVRLWDTYSGQHSHTLSGDTHQRVSSVTYSPNGQQIAFTSTWDYTVRLWDAHSGQYSHTLRGHTNTVSSLAYSSNGQQIASGSWDKTVRLWDARSGQHEHTLSGHTSLVTSVAYSLNDQQIASGSEDNRYGCGTYTLVSPATLCVDIRIWLIA